VRFNESSTYALTFDLAIMRYPKVEISQIEDRYRCQDFNRMSHYARAKINTLA
jgi:hypothetical protein